MASYQEDWQSTKNTVLERSRHMFNNSLMSDVVLTCEGFDNKYFAHKYVLATSSAVFYAMFYGNLAERNSVTHFSDTNEKSLQEFLRFIYTDECDLTTDNVASVLYLAKKYIVPSLAQKCTQFLEANIAPENVFTALQQANKFDEEKLKKKCWDLIDLKTSEAVASDAFTGINQTILAELLKRETLKVTEVDLFKAVLRWSVEECKRKGIESSAKNKRTVLGNAIYQIRFGSMSLQEFAQNISESGLLMSDEMLLFYEKFGGIEKASEVWNMTERGASTKKTILLACRRFSKYGVISNLLAGVNHIIGVSFSKPVKIHGVRFIGEGRREYDVLLKVCSQEIHQKYIAQCGSPGFFDVMLPAPIEVQADVTVQLKATVRGQTYWAGLNGSGSTETNGITVNFFTISTLGNTTTVERGQFDEIIFSEC